MDFNFSQEEPAVKTNLQDTFKPENLMMEQNRQRVLNDSLLNKFKNEQLLFSEAQLTPVVDIKDIEVMKGLATYKNQFLLKSHEKL